MAVGVHSVDGHAARQQRVQCAHIAQQKTLGQQQLTVAIAYALRQGAPGCSAWLTSESGICFMVFAGVPSRIALSYRRVSFVLTVLWRVLWWALRDT